MWPDSESVILSGAKDLCSTSQVDERRETAEILRGVYPKRTTGILRFARNDKRRTQDDRRLIFRTFKGTGQISQLVLSDVNHRNIS